MKLYIKNMVCDRCKAAIKIELDQHHIHYQHIELGEVELSDKPSAQQLENFQKRIQALGFELIEDKTARTISRIKSAIIDFVHYTSKTKNVSISQFLSEKLNKEFSGLSSLFSEVEGITIERYLILQKIERAKELLVYDEYSLSEIADMLNYSSAPHLSNQFKKITGLTPGHFKKIGNQKRTTLDKV